MKKLIIITGFACMAAGLTAQPTVRIGNMEIILRKHEQDTTMQINIVDENVVGSSATDTKQKSTNNFRKYYHSDFFYGIGFIIPDNGNDYYTMIGGKSINIDAGWLHKYQVTQRFALTATLQYSYYNYKLKNIADDPTFIDAIFNGNKDFDDNNISKQVFRSHNLASNMGFRYYFVKPAYNTGAFIDLGVQGDWAFNNYYKLKFKNKGSEKYHDDYAFNPFTASGVARIGWKKKNDTRAIFVRYRLTEAFNSKEFHKDLPPITIGIQFF